MANPEHVKWLREGVHVWNARMRASWFQVDLRGANLRGTDLQRADLQGAYLQGADLRGADLREANLREADLRGANLKRADARTIIYSAVGTNDENTAEYTDLSTIHGLTQNQVDEMHGDSGTILPEGITRPAHWEVLDLSPRIPTDNPAFSDETARGPSPVRFTPPSSFKTKENVLDLDHTPTRPEARRSSRTPIDTNQCEKQRKALREQFRTLCKLLRKYKREDIEISNRVRVAEQMLITAEALVAVLGAEAEDFQPTLLEDYTETLALGFHEDKHAFISNDYIAFDRAIARARKHCNCYPELVEANDPTNTRHIPDEYPYTVTSLSAALDEIVYSSDGATFFSDSTRELIEAEKNALVRPELDEEKTKLARLSAISGEMWREMKVYRDRMSAAAGKVKDGVDKGAAWLKTFEKVQKIWDAVEPFIGNGPPDT